MPSAARQACAACSASSSGAFQNAMMQSPMYLSIVPLHPSTTSVIGVSSRLTRAVRPCGSALYCSEIVVKPRTSQNMMVMVRCSPPSRSRSGCFASSSTSSGARYCLKAPRTCRRSASDCVYEMPSAVANTSSTMSEG